MGPAFANGRIEQLLIKEVEGGRPKQGRGLDPPEREGGGEAGRHGGSSGNFEKGLLQGSVLGHP